MLKHALMVVSMLSLMSKLAFADVSALNLKLPFPAKEIWVVTTSYGGSSTHVIGEKDGYALDFTHSGGGTSDLGRPILAATDGRVIEAKCSAYGYGCRVKLTHNNDSYRTLYAHLITITVNVGDNVVRGQVLGLCGSTGLSSLGPHLHFALYPVVSGKEVNSVKPEPMDGQTNFAVDTSQLSTNIVVNLKPVGYLSGDLETGFSRDPNGISAKFAEAHRRTAVEKNQMKLEPTPDSGNPQGIYVHSWNGASGVNVQNFDDTDLEKRGAILYRNNASNAFVVRAGFWEQYRYNNGPSSYGVPVTGEGCWKDLQTNIEYQAAQQFEQKMLLWSPNVNNGSVTVANAPSGIISIIPCGNVNIAAFTGSNEKTFKVELSSSLYNQVTLNIINESGISYDYIRIYRNGLPSGDFAGNPTTITDYGVSANTAYTYHIEGRLNNWGALSVSDPIAATTAPNPNTFALTATPRSADIIDIEILDTEWNAPLYRLYRDGQTISITSGREFTDTDVLPETTYTYYAEAMTASQIVLDVTTAVNVTTPALPEPPPPLPPPPPPEDPVFTLRLVSGIDLIDPIPPVPVLVNGCAEIRFTLENVGSSPVTLDRVRAIAIADMGFQTVNRNYPADEFALTIPLTLNPGERYTYQRDNCNEKPYPALPAAVTVKPVIKLDDVPGEWDVADIADNASWLVFQTFPSYQNPDLVIDALRLVPEDPDDNDTLTAEFDVKNIGDALSPAPYLKVILEDGSMLEQLLPQIDAGATVTQAFSLGLNQTGFHALSYVLDPNDYIFEWNEKNNTGSFTYRVGRDCGSVDSDSDGIFDLCDNCSSFANTDQRDTNLDGYGNVCDTDYNNDGIVGTPDYLILVPAFGSRFGDAIYNPDIDSNGDGVIGTPDFLFLAKGFGSSPGPSGLSCAGTAPCN